MNCDMKLKELRRRIWETLLRSGLTESYALRVMNWVLTDTLSLSLEELILRDTVELSLEEVRAIERAIDRVLEGEPIEYVMGYCHFRGLKLKVDRRALIPRPTTELLVDVALELIDKYDLRTVVDMGTGSGAIALALKNERPHLKVIATDISEDAITLTRENAELLGIDLETLIGDKLEPVFRKYSKVDLVVSNPPYVSPEWYDANQSTLGYEPRIALVPAYPLEFYEYLASKERGKFNFLALELGFETHRQAKAIFESEWNIIVERKLNSRPVAIGLKRKILT